MPQEQTIEQKLAGAKAALAHANTVSIPKPAASTPAPKAAPASTPAKKAPSMSDELDAKNAMVKKAMQALPKMHEGGPVAADGAYQLKAGEHVLTAKEAQRATQHALIRTGMRSLAKASASGGQPVAMDKKAKMPASKKSTTGITVRPEKKQGKQVVDKTKKN
jgi:hypothetical protein